MPIARSALALGRVSFTQSASAPALGAHTGDWQIDGSGFTPQVSSAINTQASGSSVVVLVLGETIRQGVPTDNKSNSYTLSKTQGYFGGAFAGFDLKSYPKTGIAGGSGHTWSLTKSANVTGETTLLVIEAKGCATLQAESVTAVAGAGAGVAYTSSSVTTTGPALLVAMWGGDGGVGTVDQTATVEGGWTALDSLFLGGTAYIQAATASKFVSGAGTYTVSWTPVANQGAILYLAAFQA